jgi:hypothetical protein
MKSRRLMKVAPGFGRRNHYIQEPAVCHRIFIAVGMLAHREPNLMSSMALSVDSDMSAQWTRWVGKRKWRCNAESGGLDPTRTSATRDRNSRRRGIILSVSPGIAKLLRRTLIQGLEFLSE